jgi:hypothetical protein
MVYYLVRCLNNKFGKEPHEGGYLKIDGWSASRANIAAHGGDSILLGIESAVQLKTL